MEKINSILHITRSSIVLLFNGKELTVPGEAYERGYGSPDFVAYLNSVKSLDLSTDGDSLINSEKENLREILTKLMSERQMIIEFE